jgi:hypothetical protein
MAHDGARDREDETAAAELAMTIERNPYEPPGAGVADPAINRPPRCIGPFTRFDAHRLIRLLTTMVTPWGHAPPVAPRTDPLVASRLIFTCAGIFCTATLVSAFALSQAFSWARIAYILFACSIGLYMATFVLVFRVPDQYPSWLGVTFLSLLVGGLYWGWVIAKRVHRRASLQ